MGGMEVIYLSDPRADQTVQGPGRQEQPERREKKKDPSGLLLVSLRGTAYAEIEVPDKKFFDLVLPGDLFRLGRDLVFKAVNLGAGPVLTPADSSVSLSFQKKTSGRLQLYSGAFFIIHTGRGAILECMYRKYGEEYKYCTSYSFAPGAGSFTIGRSSSSTIQCTCRALDQRGSEIGDVVSRDAAEIFWEGGEAFLEDHSRHGIYVNGLPVRSRRRLFDNDVITFWNNYIVWHKGAVSIRNSHGGFVDPRKLYRL